jgi:putative PIN family toxin of toxin-antitoxin system
VRIVLDTNILVSGLLSPAGPPGRILDLVAAEQLSVLYDDRIIAEYRDVLTRPRLRIEPWPAKAFLELIEERGLLISAPPLSVELPDPDDVPFVEVAEAGGAAFLVTGNERHFKPTRGQSLVPVVSPAVFLTLWLSRSREDED